MSGLWAQRDFRRLWLGRTTAAAGFQVGVLALQVTAAVSLNAPPFEMGLLVAANSSPGCSGRCWPACGWIGCVAAGS